MTFCKNVAILLQHRARSDAMHKFRRIKMSPCKNVRSCKSDPSCKRVAVQKYPLVQKWRSCKRVARAKVTRSHKLDLYIYFLFCSKLFYFFIWGPLNFFQRIWIVRTGIVVHQNVFTFMLICIIFKLVLHVYYFKFFLFIN